MLRNLARLMLDVASTLSSTRDAELDESLWSPSGWSTAATGRSAGPQFYAVPMVEAPTMIGAQPSHDEDVRIAA